MSKRKKKNLESRNDRVVAQDGFVNETLRLGQGADNTFSETQYKKTQMISWDRATLDAAYRQNWVVGKVVDIFAKDMTREWITITGGYDPEDIAKIEKQAKKLKLRESICSAIKWSRLYGGSGAILMIDGEDLNKPYNLDNVTLGSFKGLYVLDRWTLWPTINCPITEKGPTFGYPAFYRIGTGHEMTDMYENTIVHHSKLCRFIGIELPYWQKYQDLWWGESIVERIYDRLCAFDNITFSLVNLVFKAQLRVVKLDGLRKLVAKGGEGYGIILNYFEQVRKYQASDGITLLDNQDTFNTFNPTYAGLKDITLIAGEQLAGAAGIPYMILFGRSQTGIFMGSDQDTKSYYNAVLSEQESQLREVITKVYRTMIKSMGMNPEPFDFEFKGLWKATPPEASKMAAQDVASVVTAFDAGLISRKTALSELRHSSLFHGKWASIDLDMINHAEDTPLPRAERNLSISPELKRELEFDEMLDNFKSILSSYLGNHQYYGTSQESEESSKAPNSDDVDERAVSVPKSTLGAPRIRL